MIVRWFITGLVNILEFIIVNANFPDASLATSMINGVDNLITYFFANCSALLFFFVPQTTFFYCLDLLFVIWIWEPTYLFVMWLIKKIPFLAMR